MLATAFRYAMSNRRQGEALRIVALIPDGFLSSARRFFALLGCGRKMSRPSTLPRIALVGNRIFEKQTVVWPPLDKRLDRDLERNAHSAFEAARTENLRPHCNARGGRARNLRVGEWLRVLVGVPARAPNAATSAESYFLGERSPAMCRVRSGRELFGRRLADNGTMKAATGTVIRSTSADTNACAAGAATAHRDREE